MDLDFSFTLVSSLTPRSKTSRTPFNDNKKPFSKSLKSKQIQSVTVKGCQNKPSEQENKKDKENCLPKKQQMNKNVYSQTDRVLETKFVTTDNCSNRKSSFNFCVDMANIAVRKTRSKCTQKANSNLLDLSENESLKSPPEASKARNGDVLVRKDSFCSTLDQVEKVSSSTPVQVDSSNNSHNSYNGYRKGVKRKSPLSELEETKLLTESSIDLVESSIDLVESSVSEVKNDSSTSIRLNKDLTVTNKVRRNSSRISGVSETSLSSAYDSDSFRKMRRRGAKVIPETPETDESLKDDLTNNKELSLDRVTSERNINDSNLSSNNSKNGNRKCLIDKKVAPKITSSPETQLTKYMNSELEANPKKKLRSSNSSLLSDMFKFESSIKNQPKLSIKELDTKEETGFNLNKKDKRKLIESPVLRKIITDVTDNNKSDPVKEKKQKSKKVIKLGNGSEGVSICKKSVEENNCGRGNRYKMNNQNVSPICSPKSPLILPSEVIPKFEHISNWLKDTQEKSVISISSNSVESPEKALEPIRQKTKSRVTLSPRIKRKMKIAQNTLEEEQKIFEQIHGVELAKRLSDEVDEVDEVVSIASSRDSVELSENVLEKLYGTVWKKKSAPQSEPRKPRKKNVAKKKSPQTERRKQRTSIYEVFSSSSSEDRFEEFLESVQRGKLDSTRRCSGRPGTPDFINDSDSDSGCSLVFYQNIVSSAVKEDVDKIRSKDSKHPGSGRKLHGRRLSFTSSKDDGSESGKSDVKSFDKSKKTSKRKETKNSKPKSRSKKQSGKEIEKNGVENTNIDVNCFTLVTPIKIKDSSDEKLSTRIKNIIDPQVPRTVGKSRTPINKIKQNVNPSTEEKLRAKYLGDNDFKIPTNLASLKTPTNSAKKAIPSSPALSFLSSLSDMTAGLPCHPDAAIYKKDFKNKREELSKKLFSLYNKEVFDNKLPADMLIQWNTRMTSTSGYCYNKRTYSNNQIFRSSRIVLSTKILDRADRLRDTLIHELCHAATWIVNATSDGHGSHWRAWADKANRRFPELPVIKRCHDYAITTKFTYKCMSCGYCIGRHSKSLDTARKRCGFCFGQFQVFVTAKMSSASATSGSDSVKTQTQRTPSGFALFVKDNYAAVKKENNVPHGQVMKLLSQKFAEVKISKQTIKEPL